MKGLIIKILGAIINYAFLVLCFSKGIYMLKNTRCMDWKECIFCAMWIVAGFVNIVRVETIEVLDSRDNKK